jgi:protein-disulfide isomerase
MRTWQVVRAATALALSLSLTVSGCTSQVSGTAERDPATAPLAVTKDKYGIAAGFDDAPVRLEIYTEPQCNHCADLQADFGDQLKYYIGIGQLQVTYRPLTFLDTGSRDHSARVSNALFLAAGGDGGGDGPQRATGTQFQKFVEELWSHQQPGGTGPSDDEIADFASDAGIPAGPVNDIRGAKTGVDVAELENINFEFLTEVGDGTAGTPTVYDIDRDQKVDIYDNDWLSKLMQR